MALILKLSLPIILDFFTGELPLFWSMVLSWLQPPYLYLLINCIIITIVASSKLHLSSGEDGESVTLVRRSFSTPVKVPVEKREDSVFDASIEDKLVVFGYVESPIVTKEDHHIVTPSENEVIVRDVDDGANGNEFVMSKSSWKSPEKLTPVKLEYSPASSSEKPPFSLRFGHRRAVKASPEGKAALGVSRPKKQETLESTWRTITEGRSMPLKRHLKKSDTFSGASPENSPVRVMKKFDTINCGNSSPAMSGSGVVKKESSLSQDELNKRVEAFIKKFNEEMRLQRQESLNHYRRMINVRGTQ
ncbi:unnamed protein product [Amaranthus hypochondriacus]